MKSKLFSLVALISVVSLLAGCDTGGNATATAVPVPTDTSAPAPPTTAATGGNQFAGVEVNILTFNGPQIAEPLQRRAPDFAKLTGAKINVIAVPFSDIYQKA